MNIDFKSNPTYKIILRFTYTYFLYIYIYIYINIRSRIWLYHYSTTIIINKKKGIIIIKKKLKLYQDQIRPLKLNYYLRVFHSGLTYMTSDI